MASQDLRLACSKKDVPRINELLRSARPEEATACLPNAWPDITTMRLLMEHDADPSVCATVRHMKESLDIVKLLVEFGYDIEANGHLILQDFATDRDALDWLLDQGVDINLSDTERTDTGQRPGHCRDYSIKVLNNVAANGDIELFDHLVARGADPHRSMALHCASKCHSPGKAPAMIEHLLDAHHMDVEADNEALRDFFHASGDSGTPLNCAVYYQNLPAVRKLLKRGAAPDKALYATIDPVIDEPWIAGLAPLLDAGANADHGLEHAVDHLRFEAAEICVAKGAINAAKVLAKQQARVARLEKGEWESEEDPNELHWLDVWSEDDDETASQRRKMRDFLQSASSKPTIHQSSN